MADFERELSKLLEKEQTVLENLDKVAGEKSSVLAGGDIDALAKLLDVEQPLAMQCQSIETKRIDLLRKNKMLGKTLREICVTADPEYKDVLQSELNHLTEVTRKLKEKNDINNELTKSRLEFYGKMRSVLTKPVYGYDKEPAVEVDTDMSIIDRKI